MNPKNIQDFENFMLVLDKAFQRLLMVSKELMEVWKKTFLNKKYAKILFKKGYMLHFYYLRYLNTVSDMCEGCQIVFQRIIQLSDELQQKRTMDTVSVIRLMMEVENLSNVLKTFNEDSTVIKDDTLAFHLGMIGNDFQQGLNFYSCTVMALLVMGAVYTGWEGPLVLGTAVKYGLSYQTSRDHYEIRDAVKKLHDKTLVLIRKSHGIGVLMNTTTQYINGISSLVATDEEDKKVVEIQAAHVTKISQNLIKRLSFIRRTVLRSQDTTFKFIRKYNTGVIILPK